MAITFKLQIDTAATEAYLAGVRARAGDLRPALRAIGRAGVNQTRRRFQAGRGPDGAAWKKSNKPTGQTLIDKGLLLRSISDRPPEANAVEWGSNRSYARVHQLGFNGPVQVPTHVRRFTHIFGRPANGVATVKAHTRRMKMPARPYLGVNSQDMVQFGHILVRHVGGTLDGDVA